MQQEQAEITSEMRWPDFYTVLKVSPQENGEMLKKAINTLYERANEFADHRDLSKRFYSQVLREKVLPQCRRILLDPALRTAYDEQLRLHQEGSTSAVSYTEFVIEITKSQHVSTAFTYTGAEMSVLPGFRVNRAAPEGQMQTEVRTSETVTMRMTSTPAIPPIEAAAPPAPSMPGTSPALAAPSKQNIWPMVGAGAVVLALVIGGAAMFGRGHGSQTASAPATVSAAFMAKGGIVTNGDMSQTQGGVPAGWTDSKTEKGTVKISADTGTFKSAPGSLCIESVGGEAQGWAGQTLQTKGGMDVTISGQIKSEGGAEAFCSVQSVGKATPFDYKQIMWIPGGTDWKSFSIKTTLPPGLDKCQLCLSVKGTGKAWLDDVQIEPAS